VFILPILAAATLFTQGNKKSTSPRFLAFLCCRSIDLSEVLTEDMTRLKANREVAAILIPCIGVLGGKTIKSSFSIGAEAVMIIGCHTLDCHYREGKRKNDIHSIEELILDNVTVLHTSPVSSRELERQVNEFLNSLK